MMVRTEPLSGAAADLFGGGANTRQTAQAAADRLFEKERELFYQICLELGLDVAQEIFAARPKLVLSDRQREKLKKLLINNVRDLKLRHTPEFRNLPENAKAGALSRWHKKITAGGGTPEYHEFTALLATIVRESDMPATQAARGKQRYARITKEQIRKQFARHKNKKD
jgi:hypothetical protein